MVVIGFKAHGMRNSKVLSDAFQIQVTRLVDQSKDMVNVYLVQGARLDSRLDSFHEDLKNLSAISHQDMKNLSASSHQDMKDLTAHFDSRLDSSQKEIKDLSASSQARTDHLSARLDTRLDSFNKDFSARMDTLITCMHQLSARDDQLNSKTDSLFGILEQKINNSNEKEKEKEK